MKSSKKKSYDPSMYRQLSLRDQILEAPDTYISSTARNGRLERVYDIEKKKMVFKNITTPLGLERLFLEILSNAGDNVFKSRMGGIDPLHIDIKIKDDLVSITNYGIVPSIEKHPETKIYVPEMIFGNLLTSSNYNDERTGAGRNGYGAKLTNIFSKKFFVQIVNTDQNLYYGQCWEENMGVKNDAIIKEVSGDNSCVMIEYIADLERFEYSNNEGYEKETIELFMRHAIDTSLTNKVIINFNNIKFDIDIATFTSMIYEGKNKFYHYEWPRLPSGCTITAKKSGKYAGSEECSDKNVIPDVELAVLDTPHEGCFISFVNGIVTSDGGSHVDCAYKAIGQPALKIINNDRKILNIADVKNHLTIIISIRVMNPTFTSQSKTKMVRPTSIKINVSEEKIKKMEKWDFLKKLYESREIKEFNKLKKTDGKRKKKIKVKKCEDANKAGGPESNKCILILVEGDSAASTALKYMDSQNGQEGRDYWGLLPLRGKLLNVRNCSALKLSENKEICEMKEVIGLREGVDYSIDSNFSTLRYGNVLIFTDADADGFHIAGLLLNMFDNNYKGLIDRGYVSLIRTRLAKVTKGKEKIVFHSISQYNKWMKETENSKTYNHSWYKGLGSLGDNDVKEEVGNPKISIFFKDNNPTYDLDMVFNDKRASDRKKWITYYDSNHIDNLKDAESISYFIQRELIWYPIECLSRAIPKMDGFKDSIRKIIWIIMKKYMKQEKLVNQIAAGVAEHTDYHHGQKSLEEAIFSLAAKFPGKNNIPLIDGTKGQFGTRNQGGTDHAASRYPFAKGSWILEFLIRKEDDRILEYELIGQEKAEPKIYYPIIPIHLLNGINGIATGYSTFFASYNPFDLISWIKAKINETEFPKLIPFYDGYGGEISLFEKTMKVKGTDEEKIIRGFRSKGKMIEEEDGSLHIIELPLFIWTKNYKNMLDDMIEEKKLKDYRQYSKSNTVYIILEGFTGDVKELALERTHSLNNMTILDNDCHPKKYPSIDDAMEDYYNFRLCAYDRRKAKQLEEIKEEIEQLEKTLKYIIDVVESRLIVLKEGGRKKKDIETDMSALGHDKELLKIPILKLTKEEINILKNKIESKKREYDILEKTKPSSIWDKELDDLIRGMKRNLK